MTWNRITAPLLRAMEAICGPENVMTAPEEMMSYGRDETEDLHFLPEVVVRPRSAAEVAALLRLCNDAIIPVTPRGGGTGLSGGALPVHGGVVLSLERLNQILQIDTANLQATVEAGVITGHLILQAADAGLLYPVDPASKGSCFIGGNLAHCAGGPRVVKYGTLREYVLNLEVALPSGELIWTGANTLKYSSGYNLTQLFLGSEGTLGIITKAVLKLLPKPQYQRLMLVGFPSNELACAAVSAIFMAGVVPSALEFMERQGVEWVTAFEDIAFEGHPDAQAFLLIETDGNDPAVLMSELERISIVVNEFGANQILRADTTADQEELWRVRRRLPVSVKSNSVYKEEDTVVPRAALPDLIRGIKEIGDRYGFQSVCYGHAGDGNLHVNIIKGDMSDERWNIHLPAGIREIFELTVALGGTLSGEHGIGLVQKDYMPVKFSEVHLDLLRGIKRLFDPKGIMNPGKMI